jgi:hypothetical protein
MGRVAHIIDSPEEAAALYTRLYRAGQRNLLGSSDADLENFMWSSDGGQGAAPAAWVRAGDGVVRFNLSRFTPNMGGYTDEPLGPIGPGPSREPARTPGGGGVPRFGEWARLPEYAGAPPLYGPGSRVAHVINDLGDAQALWSRLVHTERQLQVLEHDDLFAREHWNEDRAPPSPDDGLHGPSEPPIAWVRTGDGVIRFNLGRFVHPERPPEATRPRE